MALAVVAALRAVAEARDRSHRELAVQEFQAEAEAEADWVALADRQPTAGRSEYQDRHQGRGSKLKYPLLRLSHFTNCILGWSRQVRAREKLSQNAFSPLNLAQAWHNAWLDLT